MRKLLNHKWLLIILFIGVVLRVTQLSTNPPALYGDELTLVYDSYSLLKTGGYDSTGQFLPITFSMGAGRPAGYVYLTVPFVAVFGPTAEAVRALSVVSGMGLILMVYLLGKKLFNQSIGLVGAALMSVSIGDISLSRGGFEAHLALFLMSVGIYLFLFKNIWKQVVSAICFGLVLHTYPIYKLLLPLILGLLFWYQRTELKIRGVGAFILVISVFLIISVQQFLFNNSEQRFSNINAFSRDDIKQTMIQKINNERNVSRLPEPLKKLLYNQPLEYGSILLNSYLSNFSLDYLVFHGDGNPRHNPTHMGIIYYVELLTIILGLVFLKDYGVKKSGLLIGLLLISPLATSLLLENHSLRNSFMILPLTILSSIGIYNLYKAKGRLSKLVLVLIIMGVLWQFVSFTRDLFFLNPVTNSTFWSLPAKDAATFINQEKSKYDHVLVSDRLDNIEYALEVYTPLDPKYVIEQRKLQSGVVLSHNFKKFDNIYLGGIQSGEIETLFDNLKGRVLYVGPVEKIEVKNVITHKGFISFERN
jgi:4-amino-4-deoxy-L-arabinose transferase-like glycosyltransferase